MKVKDLYWAARNSTFFINLESEGRPLLCGPKVSEDGVRIRLWLRNLAEGTGAGGAIVLLSRHEAAVLANAINTRSNRDLHNNPVHGMRGSGTHRTPSGGWRAFGVVSARHGRRLLACPLRIRAGGGEMSDKMMRRTLIVCAGVLVLCGLPMVVMAVVQRDVRMGLYGVMSLLFALSDVLQLFLVGGCWAAPSGHDVRFEDAAGRWVYEGQLRADTVRHGVIPDRSNHQERHEILRVESFDGDVKAVQSFLNEHDAGYIAEVTPEQPIIVEALGNKACVYVTKIVQCELRDVLRLLEAK